MKKCQNCNISVGGTVTTCPLCQNKLTGEASENNWPPRKNFKTRAFQYKLQLFIVLAIVAVSLLLDYRTNLNDGKHWSLVVTMWGLTIEVLIRDFIRKNIVVPKIITYSILSVSVLLGITSYIYNFKEPILYLVIPILISALIIANFVFSIIDKSGNALVYLLSNIIIGIIPYIVFTVSEHDEMLPWTICLMITIVAFLGIMIFRGRKVLSEIQKRFNL